MQDFKKLRVWQLSQDLAFEVAAACKPRVFSRRPGLRSQTVRTADSIATNISEGSAKAGLEFARYLDISLSATNELENHLITARRADLLAPGAANRLIDTTDLVRRMLIRLIEKVRGAL